jgi:predicted nucleic acid-binding protein
MVGSKIVYWDSSALIATLFNEANTEQARTLAAAAGTHLMSSLAWAEVHAVLARARQEPGVATTAVAAAQSALQIGPWTYVNALPGQAVVRSVAQRWPLRGADLWHLALAKTLHENLPEMCFATYDHALAHAAAGEGFATL